ncbi:hypothetical protein ACFL4W_02210 [Planctomycetota bacterium]
MRSMLLILCGILIFSGCGQPVAAPMPGKQPEKAAFKAEPVPEKPAAAEETVTEAPPESPAQPALVESIKVPISRDVWLSSYNEEKEHSMGKTPKFKIKGRDEFALMDFETEILKGKEVVSAYLHCRNIDPAEEVKRLGLGDRPDVLRHIGVSTVSSRWEEGQGSASYKADTEGGGASFNEASTGKRPWAWKGSRLFDVIMGRGHGLYSIDQREHLGDHWWRVKVDPAVIQALVAGKGDGLAVMEMTSGAGWAAGNNYVHTRESQDGAPYLMLEVKNAAGTAPQEPMVLNCRPAVAQSSPFYGALKLTIQVPADALSWDIQIDGQPAPLWQIPFAGKPGEEQEILLTDLVPDKDHSVIIAAVDKYGRMSPPMKASGRSSALLKAPAVPVLDFEPEPGIAVGKSGRLAAYAVPALAKVDPLSGKADGADITKANAVWNGGRKTVRLTGARGEIVSFQLVIRVGAEGMQGIEIVSGPGDTVQAQALPAKWMKFYRAWYVPTKDKKWQAEYAVPLKDAFNVPWADNKIEGQRFQPVSCDIVIPKDAEAGTRSCRILVRSRGDADGADGFYIPLNLKVYDTVIPDELTFNPELNCYGIAFGGGAPYFAAHKLAHYNRCTLNTLPYNQSGRVRGAFAVPLEGSGKALAVTDWTAFDREIGPILSGEAFKDNPRKGVPVKTFYLPFCEGWPSKMLDHISYNPSREDRAFDLQFNLNAPPLDELFDQDYRDALTKITEIFIDHFEAKGYTRTQAQFYLNNKQKKGRQTWWTLDEPRWYLDFAALAFHSEYFHKGLQNDKRGNFVFRGDISRPHWQFDWCDQMEVIYTNSKAINIARTIYELKARSDMTHYIYGSCNSPDVSNTHTAAWCLKAFSMGAVGVLPWQTIGNKDSLRQADINGILVKGDIFAETIVGSYRMQALREGAQISELLLQLCEKKNITREQAGLLVAQFVPLGGEFKQAFADEASAVTFGKLDAGNFVKLKEALLILLEE